HPPRLLLAHHHGSGQHQQRAGARVRHARGGVRRLGLAMDHGALEPHDAVDGSADAHAGLKEMKTVILLTVVVLGSIAHLAMLVSLWRARSKGAAEAAWATVPWLITALSAAPAVHHVFATGQRVSVRVDAADVAPALSGGGVGSFAAPGTPSDAGLSPHAQP